ncbi:MAG: type I methionyl aminopeptidase [Candidatus Omnitrophica bacterium CG11_big_fil_rev_8_21_14_0_20_45_26]|uniref:Methionine aminopeptidase n=1 Tax=Candidatus Abzuiibacterium crystallinum TaxID=1974748 RepID=A0A2H0LN87_9BACT|nr:MAG: type I methionyl aminopeptidase [Candidatus Omnitrophica bacterium CG11_big_fil_rev_8_21_14_0_20_45_26]PIW65089.1 MAG: type I methionyl aminopeptidase [Candidatus Omnitrophica bacterium CG12_big_fil_rev_8_21_14_0_65_45_16]
MISIKSKRELGLMREAGKKLRDVFFELEKLVRPGMSTLDIDAQAEKLIRAQGAVPAFKGYRGFPCSVCLSLNEQVVHGIPSKQKIKEGDLLSVDMGLVWKDFYSDSARTWPVGRVIPVAEKLIRAAKDSLNAGIEQMQAGHHVGDISSAVQKVIESYQFSVVRDFVGHGIGRALHEDPQVPNFGKSGKGPRLEVGMVLAIEPMVNEGTHEVSILSDGWTVVTGDGKLSSHYEDTIALTENGPEILTR